MPPLSCRIVGREGGPRSCSCKHATEPKLAEESEAREHNRTETIRAEQTWTELRQNVGEVKGESKRGGRPAQRNSSQKLSAVKLTAIFCF